MRRVTFPDHQKGSRRRPRREKKWLSKDQDPFLAGVSTMNQLPNYGRIALDTLETGVPRL